MSRRSANRKRSGYLDQLNRIFGKIKKERGKRHEERFFQAMEEGTNLPKWFKGVRRATHEQDMKQIDAVCDTDVGEFYVQVKSSRAGQLKFLRQHPCSIDIICIIIHEMVTQEKIREMTISSLEGKRNLRIFLTKDKNPK